MREGRAILPKENRSGFAERPEEKEARQSNITLESREKLSIDGVVEVISYHEAEVLIATAVGLLRVLGEKMQILDLSVNSHRCLITGQVNGMIYEKTVSEQKQGFWSRLFK